MEIIKKWSKIKNLIRKNSKQESYNMEIEVNRKEALRLNLEVPCHSQTSHTISSSSEKPTPKKPHTKLLASFWMLGPVGFWENCRCGMNNMYTKKPANCRNSLLLVKYLYPIFSRFCQKSWMWTCQCHEGTTGLSPHWIYVHEDGS